jgi:transcriptional regulator with XRE-family HTH domain
MARKKSRKKRPQRVGTVLVAGDRMKALRIQKGLTQKDLADMTGLSIGTVASLQSGGPCFPHSILQVAKTLEVPYESLALVDPGALTVPVAYKGVRLARVLFSVELSLQELDQTQPLIDLVNKVREESGAKYPIVVIALFEGSVIFELLMALNDIGTLATAFADGRLDQFAVSIINLENSRTLELALASHVLRIRNAIRGHYFLRWPRVAWELLRREFFFPSSFGGSLDETDEMLKYLVVRDPPTVEVDREGDETNLVRLGLYGR